MATPNNGKIIKEPTFKMQHLLIATFVILLAALSAALPVSVDYIPSSDEPTTSKSLSPSKPTDTLNIASNSKAIENRLDNPNYFEGDLDISQEMIDAYYGNLNKTGVSPKKNST